MKKISSILLLLVILFAFLSIVTDWLPSFFVFLFIGIGESITFLESILNLEVEAKKTKGDKIILFVHLALALLAFYAFGVQMHK